MNMMNKCAKFHEDSPSGKKVKFNLPSTIELGDGRCCVQLCKETLCKRATSVAHLTNFSFESSFLCNFHRRCVSTSSVPWCKKVKNDQKLKLRGGGGGVRTAAHALLCSVLNVSRVQVLHVESCMPMKQTTKSHELVTAGAGARGSENFARSHIPRAANIVDHHSTNGCVGQEVLVDTSVLSRVRIQHSPCKALEIGVLARGSCR